jgi:hypothetical protein
MRRVVALALTAATLSGCAYNAAPQPRSPRAAQELDRYLSGRVAGRPQACLPSYRSQDMVVIDENTVLFRDGANRYWRTEMVGGCNGLGTPGRALVTKSIGTAQLCRGDIAQVFDTAAGGFFVGGCSFGDFVPYTGPGIRRR